MKMAKLALMCIELVPVKSLYHFYVLAMQAHEPTATAVPLTRNQPARCKFRNTCLQSPVIQRLSIQLDQLACNCSRRTHSMMNLKVVGISVRCTIPTCDASLMNTDKLSFTSIELVPVKSIYHFCL